MTIKFARIDERLVHGQVMTSWIKQYPAQEILIVDDALAQDDFTQAILSMSAPSGLTITIDSVQDAAAHLQQAGDVFLLFKSPLAALGLVQAGIALDALNIGNMGSAPGRTALSKRVFAGEVERAALNKLADAGVDVYLQMVPGDAKVAYKEA